MDLSKAIAAEEGGSTEAQPTINDEAEIPFEANESTEGYALFADSASLVEAISTTIFGNDPAWKATDLEWGSNLEDYPELIEDVDLSGQQKLDLLHKLAKSTFGDRQANLNSGYGMGWNTEQNPPTVYDNEKVDHVPYLDVFSELSAFDHDTLDGGEVAELENEGLDMEDFGFDDSIIGPQLPVIDGERVPILFENGDEVTKMLHQLNSINFDEVTYCEKNGSLQGTPTLGSSESSETVESSDKAGSSTQSDDEVFSLAANPERVNEVNVSDLRGQGPDELSVSNIDSLRTIQTMLRAESEAPRTRSGAMDRLEERQNALQGSKEEPEVETDGGSTLEEIKAIYDLSELEADGVEHRVTSGKSESYEAAAKEVLNR